MNVAPRSDVVQRVVSRANQRVAWLGIAVGVVVVLAGAMSVPAQVELLERGIAGAGLGGDAHGAALRTGLRRLMLVQRLTPPIGLVFAGCFLFATVDALRGRAITERRSLLAVVIVGFLPELPKRLLQAVVVGQAVGFDGTMGSAMLVHRGVEVGPASLWLGEVPGWLWFVNGLVNPWTLASAVWWTLGVGSLLGDRELAKACRHAVVALVLGTGLAWRLTPAATALVLGTP